MNLWKQLNEDIDTESNNLDIEATSDTHIEDFVNKLNISTKAKECTIQYIKDALENDDIDEDGIIIDSVFEWAHFDSLDEIFDYIKETGYVSFSHEINNGCSPDLWSVYDEKLYNEVEEALYKYNHEFYNTDD